MPRYVFEGLNSAGERDQEFHSGTCQLPVKTLEVADLNSAIEEAVNSLPGLVRQVRPDKDQKRTSVILAKDEEGLPLYSATLNFSAIWYERD